MHAMDSRHIVSSADQQTSSMHVTVAHGPPQQPDARPFTMAPPLHAPVARLGNKPSRSGASSSWGDLSVHMPTNHCVPMGVPYRVGPGSASSSAHGETSPSLTLPTRAQVPFLATAVEKQPNALGNSMASPSQAACSSASPMSTMPAAGAIGLSGGAFPSALVAASSSVVSLRRPMGGDVSEGPSESSANVERTDAEASFRSTLPNLERFYEQIAAKAKLPETHPGVSGANWVLSLARSYRRLSKDKRRRGSLKALREQSQYGSSASSGLLDGLPYNQPHDKACKVVMEQPGWSSNTDDSGYEAGYETDADESELSEWENGRCNARQSHKRKLDALVHLTFKLGLSEKERVLSDSPPLKTPRAIGGYNSPFGVVGTHSSSAGSRMGFPQRQWLAAPPPSPGGSAPGSPATASPDNHRDISPCSLPKVAAPRSSPPLPARTNDEGGVTMMDLE